MLLFEISQYTERSSRKGKSELEPNISSVFCTAEFPNRANEPYLGHTQYSAHDPETESQDSCEPWREFVLVEVVFWTIAIHAAFEEDVLGKRDS